MDTKSIQNAFEKCKFTLIPGGKIPMSSLFMEYCDKIGLSHDDAESEWEAYVNDMKAIEKESQK